MARIRYADIEHPGVRPLAAEIAAQRGNVLHLYRMLLHSPPGRWVISPRSGTSAP